MRFENAGLLFSSQHHVRSLRRPKLLRPEIADAITPQVRKRRQNAKLDFLENFVTLDGIQPDPVRVRDQKA